MVVTVNTSKGQSIHRLAVDMNGKMEHSEFIMKGIPVKLPWIFPGAPLKINGAPGNIQGNLTALLEHGDTFMHLWTESTWLDVQMACLFGGNPLLELMLASQLDPIEDIFIKWNPTSLKKMLLKIPSEKWHPFYSDPEIHLD